MIAKQLEITARKLCVARGINPDSLVQIHHDGLAPYNAFAWQTVVAEVQAWIDLSNAIMGTKL